MEPSYAVRMPPDVRSVQVGGETIVFVDDFLEDPQALVEAAAAARFEPASMAAEKGYPGVRAPAPEAYTHAVTALLEPMIKANFGVPATWPIKLGLSAFSLTTTPAVALGPLQRVPHFDSSTPHHMAALLYLCDASHGGTGFYRHEASGWQRIDAGNRERYLDLVHAEMKQRPPPPRYFDRSDARYNFLGMMPARFNRLVLYPGSLLHSACVGASGLEADPRRGRLTVNTFYDF